MNYYQSYEFGLYINLITINTVDNNYYCKVQIETQVLIMNFLLLEIVNTLAVALEKGLQSEYVCAILAIIYFQLKISSL